MAKAEPKSRAIMNCPRAVVVVTPCWSCKPDAERETGVKITPGLARIPQGGPLQLEAVKKCPTGFCSVNRFQSKYEMNQYYNRQRQTKLRMVRSWVMFGTHTYGKVSARPAGKVLERNELTKRNKKKKDVGTVWFGRRRRGVSNRCNLQKI